MALRTGGAGGVISFQKLCIGCRHAQVLLERCPRHSIYASEAGLLERSAGLLVARWRAILFEDYATDGGEQVCMRREKGARAALAVEVQKRKTLGRAKSHLTFEGPQLYVRDGDLVRRTPCCGPSLLVVLQMLR